MTVTLPPGRSRPLPVRASNLFPRVLGALLAVLATLVPVGGSTARGSAPAPPAETLRFAVVGDTGTGDAAQFAVARQMLTAHEREKYELVLMLGDNIYGGKFKDIGRVFEVPYKPLLDRGVRFYATLGNHDQRSAAEQTRYEKFHMGGRRFYSFAPEGGLVEFFTVDTTPIVEGRLLDQLDWLDKALAASKARWKIVFLHHPPYSPGRRHGDDPVMISRVVPILERRGVRVVFSGHEHFFAKLRPRGGIEYVISGSGGKIHTGGLLPTHPNLESGNDRLHHFLLAELTGDSLSLKAIAENGAVLYRWTVPRAPGERRPER